MDSLPWEAGVDTYRKQEREKNAYFNFRLARAKHIKGSNEGYLLGQNCAIFFVVIPFIKLYDT